MQENEETVRSSYSQLTSHRKCPQAWNYRYEMQLYKPTIDPAPERNFGSWWSAWRAAEALERGRMHQSLVFEPRMMHPIDDWEEFNQRLVDTADVEKSAKRWWSEQTPEVVDAWNSKLGADLPTRLSNAKERWFDEWEHERQHERPLGVEVGWGRNVEIPGGFGVLRIVGYIDEILERTDRGLVIVRDHKTMKSMPPMSSEADMMDSQLALYAWGITPELKRLTGKGVNAIAFDRTASKMPTSPKLNKSGTLSKSTSLYDLQTYLDWVGAGQDFEGLAKDGSKAGRYELDQEMVEKLSRPDWRSQFHQRTLTPLSMNLVRGHLRAAVDTAEEIIRTRERAQTRHEAARNLGDQCKWCPFLSLCRSQMMGGADGEYELAQFGLVSKKGQVLLNGVVQ